MPDCQLHPYDQITRTDLDRPESRKWSLHPGTIGAWVAEADFGTAPAVTAALHRAVDAGMLGYLSDPLAAEHADAGAGWLRDSCGWQVPAERVHAVSDVLAALTITVRAYAPAGSAVIVPTPAYMPVLTLLPALGHPVVEVPGTASNGRWAHDLDAIDEAFRAGAKTLFLCNPHNPTGSVLTREELVAISEIVDRHGGRVFADEIHAPIRFDSRPHVPYASVSEAAAAHTITSTSASKAWNIPGLKTAQLITSNDADQQRFVDSGLGGQHGPSTLGVVATIAAYREARDWQRESIEYLASNRAVLAALLAEHAPQISWTPNEATYLAWLDLGEAGGSDAAARLRERAGVAVTAGSACGQEYERFVRLTYATPKPVLAEAIKAIGAAL